MNSLRTIGLVVVAMIASGYWLLSPGQAQVGGGGSAGANVLAVVNIPAVFRDSLEIQQLKEEFKKQQGQVEAEAKTRQTALEDRQKKLSALLPDSKEYKDRQDELLRESINFRVWLEEKQQNLINQHRLRTETFYKKISDQIATVAREDGFQVVLYREDFEVKDARSPEELLEMIRQRKVLFASARADVTAKVVARLNAEQTAQPR